ncbi:MAG: portal protein, partial [Nitrospinae bacterium]|nr:portal protein [Nitrospinota bacterium]
MNRKIRRTALDKYSSDFRSASGQQFKRAEYSPFDIMHSKIMAQQNRAERYVDYEQMEYMPEIASAMDIYADEMTTHTAITPMLTIDCHNEEIKGILHSLYSNVLNLEHNLFGWCRSMCKFGDFILYMDLDDRLGVKSVIPLPLKEVERLEGEDPSNPNYVQYQWNSGGMTFENWQVAHFRVLGNDKYAPYGTSVLESGRRIWRQLVLMEDAMMAYRIVRSAERRVFYIDVGNIAPQDVEQFVQKTMTSMKRNQVVNADTGRVDLRYNPLSVEEDYFIPIRGGESSKIDTLQGGQFTGDIDDVKYLRDKMFSALKIPTAYLSSDSEANEDKTTLSQKDVRFSRTIQRLQRAVISELEKIGIVHLYTLGFRGDDLVSFKLKLINPSKIAELHELDHVKTKFESSAGAT